ncbi:MAG: MFS transporter [Pseudomonadota bacterium]
MSQKQSRFVEIIGPYVQPKSIGVFGLGISSGFPLTLVLATLTFWLAREGIDKATVGLFAGVTTPYLLKFLWAPLIDRAQLPLLARLLGQRRSWLWLVQGLLAVAVFQMGACDPQTELGRLALWTSIVAFLSASQDIIIDAYRIDIMDDSELAHGSAMINFGYRTGNLIAGAGTIWLVSQMGGDWGAAYRLTALCVVPGAVAAFFLGEPERREAPTMIKEQGEGAMSRAATWLARTVVDPLANFLLRPGAIAIIVFVIIYKVGDAMGQIMLGPMIVELGFSNEAYIRANKLVGFAALMVGIACAPPLVKWIGLSRALGITGVAMMASNLTFMALAYVGNSEPMLAVAVGVENFTSGMGLAVFITYLAGLCNVAYTATQYALLSAVAGLARTWLSTASGAIANGLGWPLFYLFTTIIALPGLILLWWLWRKGYTDFQRHTAPAVER